MAETMTTQTGTLIGRHKRAVIIGAIPVIVLLWWAFRPEKLWINQKVNEAAPFDTTSGPQPILTGRFDRETKGRATVYATPAGDHYLELSDFTAPSGTGVHVELAQDAAKPDAGSVDLGPLKSSQGDQNYDLPRDADLNKYRAVVLYAAQQRASLGSAKLEQF